MKKILLVLIALLAICTTGAYAANVGDKVGEAVYSDIVAYINNYPMPCYVIDGYAVIVAEDLRNYCCDVRFDNSTRTLSITKSVSNTFTPPQVYKTAKETGEFYTDVLYTDIQTYVNNHWVKSFNVNGKTMIVIDEFGKYMDGYEWDSANRAAKAWMTDKPQTQFKTAGPRVVTLLDWNGSYQYSSYSGYYDLNMDGTSEKIEVSHIWDYYGDYSYEIPLTKISVDGKTHLYPGDIGAYNVIWVGVCDVDTTDGVLDLAVIDEGDAGGRTLYILQYDKNKSLKPYQFKEGAVWKAGNNSGTLSVGYSGLEIIEIEDDGTLVAKSHTMCSEGKAFVPVKVRFKYTGNLVFSEIVPPYYEVDTSFMENEWFLDRLTGYERTMWQKGYIKAYCDYSNNGVVIKKGDYFKVLYWNGDDYLYIEKTNGHSGWMYADGNVSCELNEYFFAF